MQFLWEGGGAIEGGGGPMSRGEKGDSLLWKQHQGKYIDPQKIFSEGGKKNPIFVFI